MDPTTPAFWNLWRGYTPPAGNSAAGVTSNEFYLAQGASAVPPTGVDPTAAAFWGSGSQSILPEGQSGFMPTYTANFDETVMPYWLTVEGGTSFLDSGFLVIRASTFDSYVQLTCNPPVPQSNIIQMRVQRTAGTGWDGRLCWLNGNHGVDARYASRINTAPAGIDADFVTLEWDLRTLSAGQLTDWNSGVSALRFDLGNAIGDVFKIDWIKTGYY